MSWFFLALIAPFLYATTNHIDKLLLDRYFQEGGVGTLLIFSALLSGLALPFLFAIDPTPFSVAPLHMMALALVGVLNAMVLWFYLLALRNEEASVAVIFYQLVPVFGYGLGYLVLGEALSPLELAAMAIVILGTAIVSFEADAERQLALRSKTILFMTSAAFCWAVGSVIFKAVALEERVIRSLFWEHLVLTAIGIGILAFVRSYRVHFLVALRTNSRAILSLNVLNESLYMLGNVAFSFAYLLAPIALVLLVESYQPLFVFLIAIFLTVFFPVISTEKIRLRQLWQKGLAIAVTGVGTYLLFVANTTRPQ